MAHALAALQHYVSTKVLGQPRLVERLDPFERAVDEAPLHNQWAGNRLYFFPPATEYIANWISSFREFPPRAKPGTFGLSQVMEAMTAPPASQK